MKIKELVRINYGRFFYYILLITLSAGLGAIGSYLFKYEISALSSRDFVKVVIFIFSSAMLVILSSVFGGLQEVVYTRQTQSYIFVLRDRLNHSFCQNNDLSLSKMKNELVSNIDLLTDNYIYPLDSIFIESISVLFSISILFSINMALVIVTILLAFFNLILPKIMAKKTDRTNSKVSMANSKLLKTIEYWLGSMSILRRYGVYNTLISKLTRSGELLENAKVKNAQIMNISYLISAIGNTVSQYIVGFCVMYLYFTQRISLGSALVVGDFVFQIFNAVWTYEQAITQLKSVKSLNAELRRRLAYSQKETVALPTAEPVALETKNLKFKYSSSKLISYPNIKISAGEKVLLTGKSGSGKSTFFKLILGKLRPLSGDIILCDRKNQVISSGIKGIGYIPQDGVMFPGTIIENMTMFDEKLNAKAKEYISKVSLTEDIAKMPKGVETVVDIDQDNLSGGQKQKIILVRNYLYHKKFILMDEATSAVDEEATEQIIEKLLASPFTLILIAHNLPERLKEKFDQEIVIKG